MDSYLMMLYVTIEQESALKFFFVEQGWAFCKPDLSVTTDKLGPTTSVLPVVCEETEVFSGEIEPIPKLKVKIPAAKVSTKTAKRKGKRKSIKQTGRSTKLTKIMSSSLGTETNVTGVILDTDDVQNIHSGSAIAAALNAPFTQDELDIHSRSATDDALTFNAPFTVQFEDGNEMQIKVEKVAEDNESAVDDDGDDEDDTDLDYGYEGAVGGDSDVKSKGEVRADESVAKDDDCAPPKDPKRYRPYSHTSMKAALIKIRETGSAIRTTAREFGVPESSLRHKLSGKVDPDVYKSGSPPIFSLQEEIRLAEYLKFTWSVGYWYSRSDICAIATEYAIIQGYRDKDKPLSKCWYTGFLSRHPDLKFQRPKKKDVPQQTNVCITNYYSELARIMTRYNLGDKPEGIYNLDVKCVEICPKTVADTGKKSGLCSNVTVIGCGNALGNRVPPFFIFPGIQMKPEYLEGKCPGANGDVSESGCSSSVLIRQYVEHHLLKYLPERGPECPVLLLYDGRNSHINVSLIEWASTEHVIFLVLPVYIDTNNMSQAAEDTGCLGSYEAILDDIMCIFTTDHHGQSVTCNNICALGCSAYTKALSSGNLLSCFRLSGIYPLLTPTC